MLGSLAALPLLPLSGVSWAKLAAEAISKPIPSSGEMLPVIGMGTWITFNIGSDANALAQRQQVLEAFFSAGGGMIDSSPMYGSAEDVLGRLLPRLPSTDGLFSATKVWTRSGDDGPGEMEQSRRLWGLPRFDLLQIHNLLGWQAHLETLKEMKTNGQVRFIGVTTSHGRRHRELESIMADEPIDFVQLTYNLADREAEQRLLPLAEERSMAVIANRPFQGGSLIDRAKRQPLPTWAAEADCQNWSQLLLKFIVSHPAITCAIPATSQVAHMRENMGAGQGRLPDPELRRRMAGLIDQL
ncbi:MULTISPECIES: aldo/keto reductase [Thiorhodovibrio]|uniref:aldo/keto reductase n=1 Tax=Thiorhodovibrio TaxID=61593 RepID=UPI003899EC07